MIREIIPYNPKLKELAKKLRSHMTIGEALLWKYLRNKEMLGYDFDRQKPIDNYIIDFYCKDLRLAIEIDGGSHDIEEIAVNDEIRETRLKMFKINILRFKETDIRKDIKKVLGIIESWIINQTSLPKIGRAHV
jgi:very-short-patch-repair endonuclease